MGMKRKLVKMTEETIDVIQTEQDTTSAEEPGYPIREKPDIVTSEDDVRLPQIQ